EIAHGAVCLVRGGLDVADRERLAVPMTRHDHRPEVIGAAQGRLAVPDLQRKDERHYAASLRVGRCDRENFPFTDRYCSSVIAEAPSLAAASATACSVFPMRRTRPSPSMRAWSSRSSSMASF